VRRLSGADYGEFEMVDGMEKLNILADLYQKIDALKDRTPSNKELQPNKE
jgi:hypothetical protein